MTGLNCVRKGPSEHGYEVSGFIRCWEYLERQGNRRLSKNSPLSSLIRAVTEMWQRSSTRSRRSGSNSKEYDGARFESRPCQRKARLITCMAFVSPIQASSSHDSLLSCHLPSRQSVSCGLVGASLIKLRMESRVAAERTQ
jgi:hypothetical protein